MKPLKTFGLAVMTKVLIALFVLDCFAAVPATAQINYAITNGTAYVAASPDASGDIVIASTFNGYPVTAIAAFAFKSPTLASVTIPNSVTSVGDRAFSSCMSLRNVILGSQVTTIGDYAFADTPLANVTIPNSVTTIGNNAFSLCTSLTNVMLGNRVTDIGDYAFYTTSLASVTIPESVTNIGSFAFSGESLTNLSVDPANPVYSSIDGVRFNKARTILIQFPTGRSGSYVIPDSVISIGDIAFRECTGLTNVTIPDSVTTIGSGAFFQCRGLTSITVPNNVTAISDLAFSSCINLRSVTIPDSVTTIGSSAFEACDLTSMTIPDSVMSIGDFAFGNCRSLTSLMFGSSITNIGNAAFQYCIKLTSVTIPNSVTSLGHAAFSYCSSLTSVTIGSSVTNIGMYGFHGSITLTNITFLGNAPFSFVYMLFNAPNATVYYYYGTTGWGRLYGGLPTVMLGAPAAQFGAGTAGVKPGGFGFTIAGVVNQTIVVEASTNLTTWHPVWTNTLSTVSTNFSDPQWLNHPHRFYRMRSN